MSNIALRTVGLGRCNASESGPPTGLYDFGAGGCCPERIRHPGAATHKSEVLWALRNLDLEVSTAKPLG